MKKVNFTNDQARLIRKGEAAQVLGVSTRTIEREVNSGHLPKHKVRGCVCFLMEDVMRLGGIVNSTPMPS